MDVMQTHPGAVVQLKWLIQEFGVSDKLLAKLRFAAWYSHCEQATKRNALLKTIAAEI